MGVEADDERRRCPVRQPTRWRCVTACGGRGDVPDEAASPSAHCHRSRRRRFGGGRLAAALRWARLAQQVRKAMVVLTVLACLRETALASRTRRRATRLPRSVNGVSPSSSKVCSARSATQLERSTVSSGRRPSAHWSLSNRAPPQPRRRPRPSHTRRTPQRVTARLIPVEAPSQAARKRSFRGF